TTPARFFLAVSRRVGPAGVACAGPPPTRTRSVSEGLLGQPLIPRLLQIRIAVQRIFIELQKPPRLLMPQPVFTHRNFDSRLPSLSHVISPSTACRVGRSPSR